jgi:hypothetical protein
LVESALFHDLEHGGSETGGRLDDVDIGFLESVDLVLRSALEEQYR